MNMTNGPEAFKNGTIFLATTCNIQLSPNVI